MSNHEDEPGITDEDLPEELQPTDDNPLAQPLDEDEAKSADELDMHGGKGPEETPEESAKRDDDDVATDAG
ncbi:hypothetical protein [Nocardioides sp. YIM 152315]|uniref:hypothetical protein n=1 Tax=Nocardioides sp. YIM 152315 TaxID=3031760 RepID=UPI0023DBF0D0|nr:hypothetical protein [Nocardioides sp. YIM 152315]MDF1602061.1 hypothetical protein [Nocardioides sp. YIM 152315]